MTVTAEQGDRTPDTFQNARLLAKDFDGTVALSFQKSPNGLGVHEAYELSIENMFGIKALEYYKANGGLHNRAPIEVVQDLAPDAQGAELAHLTTQLVGQKLGILLGEIGSRFPDGSIWPRPTQGYLRLREQVEEARWEGRLIDDLVLSSGHEPFIEKTYSAWNIGQPNHVIAEETVRQFATDMPIEKLVKPSPSLMGLARDLWAGDYGLDRGADSSYDELDRIVYVGDDPIKDGELARNSGVEFMLLEPENSSEIWQCVASRLELGPTALRGAQDSV